MRYRSGSCVTVRRTYPRLYTVTHTHYTHLCLPISAGWFTVRWLVCGYYLSRVYTVVTVYCNVHLVTCVWILLPVTHLRSLPVQFTRLRYRFATAFTCRLLPFHTRLPVTVTARLRFGCSAVTYRATVLPYTCVGYSYRAVHYTVCSWVTRLPHLRYRLRTTTPSLPRCSAVTGYVTTFRLPFIHTLRLPRLRFCGCVLPLCRLVVRLPVTARTFAFCAHTLFGSLRCCVHAVAAVLGCTVATVAFPHAPGCVIYTFALPHHTTRLLRCGYTRLVRTLPRLHNRHVHRTFTVPCTVIRTTRVLPHAIYGWFFHSYRYRLLVYLVGYVTVLCGLPVLVHYHGLVIHGCDATPFAPFTFDYLVVPRTLYVRWLHTFAFTGYLPFTHTHAHTCVTPFLYTVAYRTVTDSPVLPVTCLPAVPSVTGSAGSCVRVAHTFVHFTHTLVVPRVGSPHAHVVAHTTACVAVVYLYHGWFGYLHYRTGLHWLPAVAVTAHLFLPLRWLPFGLHCSAIYRSVTRGWLPQVTHCSSPRLHAYCGSPHAVVAYITRYRLVHHLRTVLAVHRTLRFLPHVYRCWMRTRCAGLVLDCGCSYALAFSSAVYTYRYRFWFGYSSAYVLCGYALRIYAYCGYTVYGCGCYRTVHYPPRIQFWLCHRSSHHVPFTTFGYWITATTYRAWLRFTRGYGSFAVLRYTPHAYYACPPRYALPPHRCRTRLRLRLRFTLHYVPDAVLATSSHTTPPDTHGSLQHTPRLLYRCRLVYLPLHFAFAHFCCHAVTRFVPHAVHTPRLRLRCTALVAVLTHTTPHTPLQVHCSSAFFCSSVVATCHFTTTRLVTHTLRYRLPRGRFTRVLRCCLRLLHTCGCGCTCTRCACLPCRTPRTAGLTWLTVPLHTHHCGLRLRCPHTTLRGLLRTRRVLRYTTHCYRGCYRVMPLAVHRYRVQFYTYRLCGYTTVPLPHTRLLRLLRWFTTRVYACGLRICGCLWFFTVLRLHGCCVCLYVPIYGYVTTGYRLPYHTRSVYRLRLHTFCYRTVTRTRLVLTHTHVLPLYARLRSSLPVTARSLPAVAGYAFCRIHVYVVARLHVCGCCYRGCGYYATRSYTVWLLHAALRSLPLRLRLHTVVRSRLVIYAVTFTRFTAFTHCRLHLRTRYRLPWFTRFTRIYTLLYRGLVAFTLVTVPLFTLPLPFYHTAYTRYTVRCGSCRLVHGCCRIWLPLPRCVYRTVYLPAVRLPLLFTGQHTVTFAGWFIRHTWFGCYWFTLRLLHIAPFTTMQLPVYRTVLRLRSRFVLAAYATVLLPAGYSLHTTCVRSLRTFTVGYTALRLRLRFFCGWFAVLAVLHATHTLRLLLRLPHYVRSVAVRWIDTPDTRFAVLVLTFTHLWFSCHCGYHLPDCRFGSTTFCPFTWFFTCVPYRIYLRSPHSCIHAARAVGALRLPLRFALPLPFLVAATHAFTRVRFVTRTAHVCRAVCGLIPVTRAFTQVTHGSAPPGWFTYTRSITLPTRLPGCSSTRLRTPTFYGSYRFYYTATHHHAHTTVLRFGWTRWLPCVTITVSYLIYGYLPGSHYTPHILHGCSPAQFTVVRVAARTPRTVCIWLRLFCLRCLPLPRLYATDYLVLCSSRLRLFACWMVYTRVPVVHILLFVAVTYLWLPLRLPCYGCGYCLLHRSWLHRYSGLCLHLYRFILRLHYHVRSTQFCRFYLQHALPRTFVPVADYRFHVLRVTYVRLVTVHTRCGCCTRTHAFGSAVYPTVVVTVCGYVHTAHCRILRSHRGSRLPVG